MKKVLILTVLLVGALVVGCGSLSAYNRGVEAYRAGDYDKAIKEFTLEMFLGIDAPTYFYRGLSYAGKGDYDNAIADYTEAIRLRPNYTDAYNNRGSAYFRKNDYNRAIADFEAALRIDPNHSNARSNLALAQQRQSPSQSGGQAVLTQAGGNSIGDYEFVANYSLTTYTIPAGVTSIGDGAFLACENLTSVTIPSSVTSIGFMAFAYCKSLTSITIPAGVTSIGDVAFNGCSSLTSITVDTQNQTYSSVEGILFNKNRTVLIQYPASKQERTYAIPAGVTSIEDGAFQECSRLTSVTIPASVTSIGSSAFIYCSGLTSITVDTQNQTYSSIEGVLYNKNRTVLVVYPAGKQVRTYAIPAGVTSIEYGAFWDCTGLTSITIPASVTSIGGSAFLRCTGLTSLTIPASVTSIGESAFFEWTSSQTIIIQGKANRAAADAAWGEGWRKDCNARIVYQ